MSTKVKLLFLDIDGVLNSRDFMLFCADQGIVADDRIDPKAVKFLNDITNATGAKIVVSSTWRLPFVDHNNLDGLIDLLRKNNITGDIIGMSPDLWAVKHDRVRDDEIQDWMDNCGLDIDSFVIIDDDSDMRHLKPHLIKTKFSHGLQHSHALIAISRLGAKSNV